jgi:DNA-binding transcriptional LysR family regulator
MFSIVDMHDAHVGGLDLNLLIALRALIVERHVTRAAARVRLTQPAMSHALARLRSVLGDPLLVRTRSGMMLTPRAEELAEPLERVLADVSKLIAPVERFDPAKSKRAFRIGTSDYVELVLMPAVLDRVWREAPNVTIHLRMLADLGSNELEGDKVDLVIAPRDTPGLRQGGVRAQRILTERFVCVVREDHPSVGKRLTLDQFVALPHALITPRGHTGGLVDTALAKIGRRRRVALEVPHFLVAPFLVERTDMILTLAERIARALGPSVRLRMLTPPAELELPGFELSAVWHERNNEDPALTWFRGIVAAVAKKA